MKKAKEEEKSMCEDSKSNREKIYAADGAPFFGKVYGYRAPPPESAVTTVDVLLTKYTATAIIWKSPKSRCNKDKVCGKGKTLYVLGEMCTARDREYLVFSEESWVFKRTWSELAGSVVPAGTAIWHMDVISVGQVKKRCFQDDSNICIVDEGSKGKNERGSHRRRDMGVVQAFKVQFTSDPMSAVWFTEPGLKHMAGLVSSYQLQSTGPNECETKEVKEDVTDEDEGSELLDNHLGLCYNYHCCCVPDCGVFYFPLGASQFNEECFDMFFQDM